MSENTIKPFTMTTAGFITPMISGILSACSSSLIIYIVLRSQQKLSTTYHRIMTLMSVFDIISSSLIALGTIMMPSDNVFPFAGPMLGNKATCHAQGWLVTFGYTGATALNACLAWYFVCKITFKMDALKIRKRLEPVMYIYTLIIALFLPSFYFATDLLNTSPYDSFCTIVPHALRCRDSNGPEYQWNLCDWGKGDDSTYYRLVVVVVYVLIAQFALIALGMIIILLTVFRNSWEIKMLMKKSNESVQIDYQNDRELGSDSNHLKQLRYSRVLIFQALMYIVAYILTWALNFLSAQFGISSVSLDAVNCVLFPLQGFWNLIIFLYDKTHLIRKRGADIPFWKAAREIIVAPSDIPDIIFSNMSTVVIEPREDEIAKEEGKSEEEEEEPDVVLSGGTSFDNISKLRGKLSLEPSSIRSSEHISSTSIVRDEEKASRTNFVNTRKSWKQVRRENQENAHKSLGMPNSDPEAKSP